MKPKGTRRPASPKHRGASASGTPASRRPGNGSTPTALRGDVRALREEMERAAGQIKDAIQKIERLAVTVGELRQEVSDLRAALADGEVDYGEVDDADSEMGEGHA